MYIFWKLSIEIIKNGLICYTRCGKIAESLQKILFAIYY